MPPKPGYMRFPIKAPVPAPKAYPKTPAIVLNNVEVNLFLNVHGVID